MVRYPPPQPVNGSGRPMTDKATLNGTSASHDATSLYLSDFGFSRLLTAEEEKKCARRVRKGDESNTGASFHLILKILTHNTSDSAKHATKFLTDFISHNKL